MAEIWRKAGYHDHVQRHLGCGVPVGAFYDDGKGRAAFPCGRAITERPTAAIRLACAAVEKVLDLFEENHIIENVREVAPYLEEKLEELTNKYDCIQERRGTGLMQGLVFDKPVG